MADRGERKGGLGFFHEPAMTAEVKEYLAPERGGTYLDATLGGAGHAEAILTASAQARVLGIDRDADALAFAATKLEPYADRVVLEIGDYAEADELFDLGEGTLAGVLVDLGVSSHQIDNLSRGFSFRPGAPLDMRLGGPAAEGPTAAELLNALPPQQLARLFRRYGDVRGARRLAAEVVKRRETAPISTSDDLVEVVEAAWNRPPTAAQLAPVFQALRIAVNRELESLRRALPMFRTFLEPGGRLVVIAYHSLEDRIVKDAFREWSRECICPPEVPVCRCRGRALGRQLTRRPVRPSEEEVSRNPRARSARLRAWEKAPDADGGSYGS